MDRRRDGEAVIDNYWQTESGWPILSVANASRRWLQAGSPGVAMSASTCAWSTATAPASSSRARRRGRDRRADAAGLMQTVWRDDARFVDLLDEHRRTRALHTFDWGIRDEDGYWLSSAAPTTSSTSPATAWARARSRISSRASVAEVAVVGVADPLKGR